MEKQKLLKRIEREPELVQKIWKNVLMTDESEQHSIDVILTVWKDGKMTVDRQQSNSDYPKETYRNIKERIYLKTFLVYDIIEPSEYTTIAEDYKTAEETIFNVVDFEDIFTEVE